jgi:hypothetical protein
MGGQQFVKARCANELGLLGALHLGKGLKFCLTAVLELTYQLSNSSKIEQCSDLAE